MKKHADYVPLEISGSDLDSLIESLRDKLYNEFWGDDLEPSQKEEIKKRITKNIYSVFGH